MQVHVCFCVLVDQDAVGPDAVAAADLSGSYAVAGTWAIRRLPLAIAVADVSVLLMAFVVSMTRLEAYTFDLRFPDPLRVLAWCTVLAALWLPLATNVGVYKPSVLTSPIHSGYVTAKSTLIAGALFHIVPLVGGPVYSRAASLTVVLALVLVMLGWRLLLAYIVPTVAARPIQMVVVGAGWAGQALADAVSEHPQSGVRITAFVDNDPERVGRVEAGLPVFSLNALARLAHMGTDRVRVVLAMPEEAHASVYEELTALAESGIEVLSMASVYEQVTGRVPVRHLGTFWWAMLPKPTSDIVFLGAKRAIDILLSLVGLVVLGVLLPFIAGLQRFVSPGPLFFTQVRVGRHGRPLKLSKIRTLPVGPRVEYASYWERKRSHQTSWLGASLRATGIDELPQCWNVLRGEMSIVGPRPFVPEEVEDFQRQIPFFRMRGLVKPGLTGWAQVNWGYGLTLEDEIQKLQYDLYYVGHQCLYLDLMIILRTLRISVLRRVPLAARNGYWSTAGAQLTPRTDPK